MDALRRPDFEISNREMQFVKNKIFSKINVVLLIILLMAYLKIEKVQEIIAENKLKNKVSSLEDYWIQETEKILIMLWGKKV
jgi:hypothetical protein